LQHCQALGESEIQFHLEVDTAVITKRAHPSAGTSTTTHNTTTRTSRPHAQLSLHNPSLHGSLTTLTALSRQSARSLLTKPSQQCRWTAACKEAAGEYRFIFAAPAFMSRIAFPELVFVNSQLPKRIQALAKLGDFIYVATSFDVVVFRHVHQVV
jgi:hypothetical protein